MIRTPGLFALGLIVALHATPSLHAQQFKTIALTGDTAPGSGGSGADVPFAGLSGHPTINASGEVTFWAATLPNSDGGSSGIFSTVRGTLNAEAFEQQVAPGSGGSGVDVPFINFGLPSINASGEVAFAADTSGNVDGGFTGIFSTTGGTLNAVAFDQQVAPGSGGSGVDVRFTPAAFIFSSPSINASSEVAFVAATSPNADGGSSGIFSTVGGTLNAVAFEQQVAPGSGGSGADVPFTGFFKHSINASGEVAFKAYTSTNIDGGDEGIFSSVGGILDSVAFEQQVAPGSGGSGVDVPFINFGLPSINSSGEVAFVAATSPNVDAGDSGIFSTVGGTLHAVAFDRQVAPGSGGSGADVRFSHIISRPPSINESGEIVFAAITSRNADGGDSGIFSTAGGTLHAVAFKQQVAPGSGGSGADVPFLRLQEASINASGEVAFFANTFPNADGGTSGIFTDVGGSLRAAVFMGDQIEVSPGDFRIIKNLRFELDNAIGQPLNESGELVFWAGFTDDSEGIFVWNFIAVPEPSTSLMLAATSLLICLTRRRW